MSEEDYFARINAEKADKIARELAARRASQERKRRMKLHYLKCGKCGADMRSRLFRGVEIEYCPECGAVLLDKGELEQLAGQDRSGIFKALGDLFSG